MYPIKQSTAETMQFFAHDENGDAVLGLTDGSFTKRISKGSGTWAAMTATITEQENGWYSFPLSTAHSNTSGILTIVFISGGSKQINMQFRVQAKLADDLNDFNASSDTVASVTLVATTTTNTDMRGTDSANTVAPDNTSITAIKTKTDGLNFTGLDVNSTLDGEEVVTDSASRTASQADVSLLATAAALSTVDGIVDNILIDTGTTIPALLSGMGIAKNQAFSNFPFEMVSSTDNVTPITGATVTAQRSLDGGAYASVSGAITEVSNGGYQFDALAADTNGETVKWKFSATGANDTKVEFITV